MRACAAAMWPRGTAEEDPPLPDPPPEEVLARWEFAQFEWAVDDGSPETALRVWIMYFVQPGAMLGVRNDSFLAYVRQRLIWTGKSEVKAGGTGADSCVGRLNGR